VRRSPKKEKYTKCKGRKKGEGWMGIQRAGQGRRRRPRPHHATVKKKGDRLRGGERGVNWPGQAPQHDRMGQITRKTKGDGRKTVADLGKRRHGPLCRARTRKILPAGENGEKKQTRVGRNGPVVASYSASQVTAGSRGNNASDR